MFQFVLQEFPSSLGDKEEEQQMEPKSFAWESLSTGEKQITRKEFWPTGMLGRQFRQSSFLSQRRL